MATITDIPDPSLLSTAEMFRAILESQKRVEATVTEQVAKVIELEKEVKVLKSQVYALQNSQQE